MTNPLIKTLRESDEMLKQKYFCPCWLCKEKGHEFTTTFQDIESFNHSRSLKLLEAIQNAYITTPRPDFRELLDEAINLYKKC